MQLLPMNLLNTVLLIFVYYTNAFSFYNIRRGLLLELSISASRTKVAERSIIQPLDHFNNSDKRNWSMRYFEMLELWKQGGPVYLFIGGEGKAETGFIQGGLIYELANETNGALYMSEHRYYGKSKPFSKLNTKKLAYLSSRQALADLAKLLRQIKSLPQYNGSKVVVVGGSYSGNLAAWMRLLYPDIVDAAIASSAPVLAKTDFFEYLETVAIDYKKYGTRKCYDEIETNFNRYNRLLQTKAGIDQLKKEEKICDFTDMSAKENKFAYFSSKVDHFMSSAQYGNRTTIQQDCGHINDILCNGKHNSSFNHSSPQCEVGYWNKEYCCYECTLDRYIESIKNSDVFIAWFFQTCTEFGYFQTTTSFNQPFTNNIAIEIYYSICSKLYGAEFNKTRVDEGVKKTNEMYGGLKPNVTRVVFVNGNLDPWHRLGVLRNLSKDAPAKQIHGTSHGRVLASNNPDDPKDLKKTRKFVKFLIKKWIGAN